MSDGKERRKTLEELLEPTWRECVAANRAGKDDAVSYWHKQMGFIVRAWFRDKVATPKRTCDCHCDCHEGRT